MAEALEEVEKGLRTIKTLEAEVKPTWAPSLACAAAKAPECPKCTCPPPGDTKPEDKKEGTTDTSQ